MYGFVRWIVEPAVNRGVHGHGHRILALVVALLRYYFVLFHDRKRADKEALILAQAVAGAQA